MPDPLTDFGDGPIHNFFGLSYASYFVVPRVVLQSMPHDWQERFVALLHECGDKLGHHYGDNDYRVHMRKDGLWAKDDLADYQRGRRRLERKEVADEA